MITSLRWFSLKKSIIEKYNKSAAPKYFTNIFNIQHASTIQFLQYYGIFVLRSWVPIFLGAK